MLKSRLSVLVPMLAAALTVPACVTINIYFPAAAAEKAADRIIDEVWQAREAANAGKPSAAEPAVQPEGE